MLTIKNFLSSFFVDNQNFKFLQLSDDMQAEVFRVLLLDPVFSNSKSFVNLSLTCRKLTNLAMKVFSQEINNGNLQIYYALVNENNGYIDYASATSPWDELDNRDKIYSIKLNYQKETIVDQINDKQRNFGFKKPLTYTLFPSMKEAKDNQKTHEYDVGARFTRYIKSKPAVYEVYCSQKIVINSHTKINNKSMFFVRANLKRIQEEDVRLSQTNGFPKKSLEKHRGESEKLQHEYEQLFCSNN